MTASILAWLDANASNYTGLMHTTNEVEILRALRASSNPNAAALMPALKETLKKGPPPTPTEADAYNLTHTIMFGTDFGRSKVTLTGAIKTAWATKLSELATQYALHTDLLGEILICARCLEITGAWFDTALASFRVQHAALSTASAVFTDNYHPILVGGILFTLLGE